MRAIKTLLLPILILLTLSSCYLKQYPVTPEVADSATYMFMANDSYQGTAWAVNDHTLITAGHMCDANEDNYVAVGTTGRSFRAHSLAWEHGGKGLADLCALHTDAPLPNSLIIADVMPNIGDKVWYNGFPKGKYVRETGKYIGDTDGKDAHFNDFVATAPEDHGASGSAMYTTRGVWGVLVRIRTDDMHGGLIANFEEDAHTGDDGESCIDLKAIRSFLNEMDIKYDTTPDDLPQLVPPGGLG